MKKKLLVAAALTALAGSAMAQSAFEGAYGQLGIGYETVSPSLSIGNLNISGAGTGSFPYSSNISNSNSFAGTVTIGYNFAVTKDFLLGLGAEYSPLTGQKANYSASNPDLGAQNGQWNKQNSYNIFISPATPIGKDGLLYGKVGYTGASFKSQINGGNSNTENLNGYSLGLGYKQFITGGLFGFGEVNYASYGNKTTTESDTVSGYNLSQSSTFKANVTNILVGIGYKF